MLTKITINGTLIDNFNSMEDEILKKLNISKSINIDFLTQVNDYVQKNKIEALIIHWQFFSIFLLKLAENIYNIKDGDFSFSNQSNMHSQAINDILISEQDASEKIKRENEITQNIQQRLNRIKSISIVFEK